MKTDTSERILQYISQNDQVTVQQLVAYLGHSPQAVHRQLKKLVEKNLVEKVGTPPVVYYKIWQTQTPITTDLSDDLIEETFVEILPNGQRITGNLAFDYWCKQRNFDTQKYAKKYHEIYHKYEHFRSRDGWIDATEKLLKTYQNSVFLKGMFYLEFSALEIFGQTKWYLYLLYSKLNEDRKLMHTLFTELNLQKTIQEFIQKHKIQAVGFIPATVPRQIQFQKEVEKYLNLSLPKIVIQKLKTPILVPQKTLSKPQDRVVNSRTTFAIKSNFAAKRILLIDDFVGSGATLNFVAEKLLKLNPKAQIYGAALCGSPNGVIDDSRKLETVKEV